MQPERPLLTIAIPTYNRGACLADLLDVLAPQLVGEARVELLISDNASPDETPRVIESFRKKGIAVTNNRNEVNIGADANFHRCLEMAKGEYVWLVGDDDIIVPGGLEQVLARLATRRYDLINIPAREFHGRFEPLPERGFSRQIKEFRDARDFALYVSTGLTFISGMIFRKTAFAPGSEDGFKKFIGTNLLQLSWTFSLLRDNPRCACMLDRIIASRVENSGGYGAFRVFGTNLNMFVREFFGPQSPIGRAILNRTIQMWFPWAIVQSKRGRHSAHLPEDAQSVLASLYRHNPRFWFFVYPLFFLPLPLAEIWLFLIRAVNRTDRFLGYPIAR